MAAAVLGRFSRRRRIVNAENCIVVDRRCIECGTNLRGEPADGICPDCEHSNYDSLFGSYVIDAEPRVARRMFEASSVAFLPMTFLAAFAAVGLLSTLVSARDLRHAIRASFDVGLAFAMVLPLVTLVGMVAFTSRRSPAYFRAVIREQSFQRTVLGWLLGAIGVSIVVMNLWPPSYAAIQMTFVTVPVVMFLRQLARLASRIPNKRLSAACGLYVGFTIVLAALALAILLLRYYANDSHEISDTLIGMQILATFGGIAISVGVIHSLISLRRTLRSIGRF